jgi:hypothetical protein
MATLILAQIPNPHIASAITTNQLALIRMDDHIIDGNAMHVVPLHAARPRIPYLSKLFRQCDYFIPP